MTIIEKVKETFLECEPGTIYLRSEIINMVKVRHGVNEGSVIPSDYCYNLTNEDKLSNKSLNDFKIFEWISRGKYIYRGENYFYKGAVIKTPRNKVTKIES